MYTKAIENQVLPVITVVGQLPDKISEDIAEKFKIEDYNEKQEALMIVSVMLEAPTKATCEVIRKAWEKGAKIILLYPTVTAVRMINEILNENIALTNNTERMEYYGIKQLDGRVTFIEIHGERGKLNDDNDIERIESAGNEAGMEEQSPGKRKVIALSNWLKDSVPGSNTIPASSGPQKLDFFSFYIGVYLNVSESSERQDTWFAIPVWDINAKRYWVSYWVEVMYNPSKPPFEIVGSTMNPRRYMARCTRGQCLTFNETFWPVDTNLMDLKLFSPSPDRTNDAAKTVTTGLEKTMTVGVTVGTSGADASFSYGVAFNRSETITVPELFIETLHKLSDGQAEWEIKYENPQPRGTQKIHYAWIHHFKPMEEFKQAAPGRSAVLYLRVFANVITKGGNSNTIGLSWNYDVPVMIPKAT